MLRFGRRMGRCVVYTVFLYADPELCPTSFSDIFCELFANAHHLSCLIKFDCVRERYPLTSQLIQENKIPEFGEYLFDRNSV